jgi:hypothetical protein
LQLVSEASIGKAETHPLEAFVDLVMMNAMVTQMEESNSLERIIHLGYSPVTLLRCSILEILKIDYRGFGRHSED